MNEQELNKKLAEWAGWQVYTRDDCFEDVYGYLHKHFTQSLDACFKWLVPKLAEKGYICTVGSFEHSGFYAYAYQMFNPEPGETRADAPALALCLAIERLVDNEMKG